MSHQSDAPLRARISRILRTPVVYEDFPNPLIYRSDYGYDRAKCPVAGCEYDGLVRGFSQHYAKMHAPERWGQHNQQIIEVVRTA